MDKTIEPQISRSSTGDTHAVYTHDEYPQSSVLAGQARRTFVDSGSLEELQERHPDAKVLEHSTRCDPVLPACPPSWFDPMAAGEDW